MPETSSQVPLLCELFTQSAQQILATCMQTSENATEIQMVTQTVSVARTYLNLFKVENIPMLCESMMIQQLRAHALENNRREDIYAMNIDVTVAMSKLSLCTQTSCVDQFIPAPHILDKDAAIDLCNRLDQDSTLLGRITSCFQGCQNTPGASPSEITYVEALPLVCSQLQESGSGTINLPPGINLGAGVNPSPSSVTTGVASPSPTADGSGLSNISGNSADDGNDAAVPSDDWANNPPPAVIQAQLATTSAAAAKRVRLLLLVGSAGVVLAIANVDEEVSRLKEEIRRLGSVDPVDGKTKVPFGVIVKDDRCANIFEALVGTLKAAKRKKVVFYDSELLLQGVHDKVNIVLLE
ncbi:hypothetical protein HDU83_003041 [Entophlyctis luteolus]|nr:hypothetical protein HDU83_003041 [Entophlyctis luteolus]